MNQFAYMKGTNYVISLPDLCDCIKMLAEPNRTYNMVFRMGIAMLHMEPDCYVQLFTASFIKTKNYLKEVRDPKNPVENHGT